MAIYKDIEGYSNYSITNEGKVFKKTKDGYKELSYNNNVYGFKRVNLISDSGVATTKQVHIMVYQFFNGGVSDLNKNNTIIFKDGDKSNTHSNNLITVGELTDFYNRFNVLGAKVEDRNDDFNEMKETYEKIIENYKSIISDKDKRIENYDTQIVKLRKLISDINFLTRI